LRQEAYRLIVTVVLEGFRLGGGEENGNRQRKRRENRKTGMKGEIRQMGNNPSPEKTKKDG
jgi:hypothetical protein